AVTVAVGGPRRRPEGLARGHQERHLGLEEHRLLHPAGFGEHQPPPEDRQLVVAAREVATHRAAEVVQHPAVDGVAAHRTPALGEHGGLAADGALWREADEDGVHGAAAHVDHQDGALLAEADAVAERRRHRLVDEADPAYAELAEDLLHFGAVGFERRHRRGDDEVAHPLSGRPFDLAEQLAQEGVRGVAGGEALPPQPRQGTQRLLAQAGLEGGDERRMDRAFVAFERRPADERAAAEKEPALQRRPAPQTIESAELFEEMDRRRHQTRRFERILRLQLTADAEQLDEAGFSQSLVPQRHSAVRRPQVERPAGHVGPLYARPAASSSLERDSRASSRVQIRLAAPRGGTAPRLQDEHHEQTRQAGLLRSRSSSPAGSRWMGRSAAAGAIAGSAAGGSRTA